MMNYFLNDISNTTFRSDIKISQLKRELVKKAEFRFYNENLA